MASKVIDRDRGYAALMRATRQLQHYRGAVDLAPGRYRSGMTVAQVAALHERGTRRMPQRDFMGRWWTRGGKAQLARAQRRAARLLVTARNAPLAERVLAAAGNEAVRDIRAGFQRLAPLAPSTVASKGSRTILIETGLLSRSIRFAPLRGDGRGQRAR